MKLDPFSFYVATISPQELLYIPNVKSDSKEEDPQEQSLEELAR